MFHRVPWLLVEVFRLTAQQAIPSVIFVRLAALSAPSGARAVAMKAETTHLSSARMKASPRSTIATNRSDPRQGDHVGEPGQSQPSPRKPIPRRQPAVSA
jgi:hypothetical protein